MNRLLLALSFLVTVSACGGGSSAACPSTGTTLTYANFGQGFMSNYCASCHGNSLPEANVSLTSQSGVSAHASAVDSVVTSGSMPPRGATSPTAAEQAQLAEWLACGAP